MLRTEPQLERNLDMSKEAADHHKKAAEHHEHAARHHKEAAKHHEAGNHEKPRITRMWRMATIFMPLSMRTRRPKRMWRRTARSRGLIGRAAGLESLL